MFCPECGRPKLLFKSEKEAELFMHYNREAMLDETGYCPVRTYYCEMCGGWHVTSQPLELRNDRSKGHERAEMCVQHKRATARKQNVSDKLDQVEECINIAIGNFKKKNMKKARKHLQRAFRIFQQTMKTEFFKSRKLALFNQISICFDMWAA